ncbi:hypothetical protein SEA_DRYAD_12 [Streptomyces phage Dryad]|nr:hypothetical protein SEA_DRYAD_12 [Streptomyces phage Dryad]
MRPIRELLMRTTGGAIVFTKSALEQDEIEYLTELPSFVLQTDEFVITRNPVIGAPPRLPDPVEGDAE